MAAVFVKKVRERKKECQRVWPILFLPFLFLFFFFFLILRTLSIMSVDNVSVSLSRLALAKAIKTADSDEPGAEPWNKSVIFHQSHISQAMLESVQYPQRHPRQRQNRIQPMTRRRPDQRKSAPITQYRPQPPVKKKQPITTASGKYSEEKPCHFSSFLAPIFGEHKQIPANSINLHVYLLFCFVVSSHSSADDDDDDNTSEDIDLAKELAAISIQRPPSAPLLRDNNRKFHKTPQPSDDDEDDTSGMPERKTTCLVHGIWEASDLSVCFPNFR